MRAGSLSLFITIFLAGCVSRQEPVTILGVFDHKTRSINECLTGVNYPVIFRSSSYMYFTKLAYEAGTSYESYPFVEMTLQHLGPFTGNTYGVWAIHRVQPGPCFRLSLEAAEPNNSFKADSFRLRP